MGAATVIFVNPNGISCNRFAALSNTPRAALSTGGASLAPRRPRQQILLTIGTCTITQGGREPMTIIVAPAAI
ncbi:MAG: filamentous hemagglutinin N-terminal domain-containing protein [Mesorhizobium sp.]|nr:MAG: filamentous hemagglutinin N-terminal domain-containing protein [Mesorhizobium sp.]